MSFDTPLTPAAVADALVRAFRLMPGRPVLSTGGVFRVGDGIRDPIVDAFGWPERFLPDPFDRRILMTWARCRATGESVSRRYADLGWPRMTVEDRRRRALARIAAGLVRDEKARQAA